MSVVEAVAGSPVAARSPGPRLETLAREDGKSEEMHVREAAVRWIDYCVPRMCATRYRPISRLISTAG